MAPPRKPFTLPLQIELAGSVNPPDFNPRELEASVQAYASALCAEAGLPATPSVSVTRADPDSAGQGDLFAITIASLTCRPGCWPPPILPEAPSVQDYGELICLALFERRTLLLTRDLVLAIARDWGLRTEAGEWRSGWSEEGFDHFLRQFSGAHFSLNHARRFVVDTGPAGVTSESGAAILFEEAMEHAAAESADLRFGVSVDISATEYADYRSGYEQSFAKALKTMSDDLGFVCPEIRILAGELRVNEFQIGINEIHLPVIRGLERGRVVVLAGAAEVRQRGIDAAQLFNPVSVYPITCVSAADALGKVDLKPWDPGPPGYVEFLLRSVISRNAGSLLLSPTVHLLLERLKARARGAYVSGAASLFSESPPFYRRLTPVLRRLLNEQVPVADLAAITESLLSLRDNNKDGACGVYHFSDLEDSPVLVAKGKFIRDLSTDDLVFAARLGVRALAVRDIDNVRQALPVAPLPPDLQADLLSQGLTRANRDRIVETLKCQPSADVAIVADQGVRASVKEVLRFEFSSVPVFGSSEVQKAVIAAGCDSVGREYYKQDRLKDAFLMALQAVSLQPQSLIYLYNLKLTWQMLGSPAGDKEEYQIAARLNRETGWQIRAADYFFGRGNADEARLLYRDLAKLEPGVPLYRLRSGAYRRAIELYRQAFSSTVPDTKSPYNFFDALIRQGDYVGDPVLKQKYWNEARELYESAVKRTPENAWFHYDLGVALGRLRRWDTACESFRESARLDNHNVGAWRELGYCLLQQAKFGEAVTALEEARVANPSDSYIEMDLVKAYAHAERFDGAVTLARELSQRETPVERAAELFSQMENARQAAAKIGTEPQSAQAHAEFARLHEQLGNLPAAAARYRAATVADPAEPLYRRSLAGVLARLGDWPEAASEYEITLKAMPDDAVTLYGLGVVCDILKETERARSYLEQAASLAPANPWYHYNLGNAEYRLGHIEEARLAYEAAIQLDDKLVWAHYGLANCHYRLGQLEQANDEWRKTIQIDGSAVEAVFNLGVGVWVAASPQPEGAAAYWRAALRQDPNLTFAEDNLNAIELHKPPPHLTIFDLVNGRGVEDGAESSTVAEEPSSERPFLLQSGHA